MAVRSIKVTELKSHLSRYLRQASRGERITVRDRDDPIAELGPARSEPLSWRDRLVREGRLRPGTQDWGALKITTMERHVDIQSSLRAVLHDERQDTAAVSRGLTVRGVGADDRD